MFRVDQCLIIRYVFLVNESAKNKNYSFALDIFDIFHVIRYEYLQCLKFCKSENIICPSRRQ